MKHKFEFENQGKKGPLEQLCNSNQLPTFMSPTVHCDVSEAAPEYDII